MIVTEISLTAFPTLFARQVVPRHVPASHAARMLNAVVEGRYMHLCVEGARRHLPLSLVLRLASRRVFYTTDPRTKLGEADQRRTQLQLARMEQCFVEGYLKPAKAKIRRDQLPVLYSTIPPPSAFTASPSPPPPAAKAPATPPRIPTAAEIALMQHVVHGLASVAAAVAAGAVTPQTPRPQTPARHTRDKLPTLVSDIDMVVSFSDSTPASPVLPSCPHHHCFAADYIFSTAKAAPPWSAASLWRMHDAQQAYNVSLGVQRQSYAADRRAYLREATKLRGTAAHAAARYARLQAARRALERVRRAPSAYWLSNGCLPDRLVVPPALRNRLTPPRDLIDICYEFAVIEASARAKQEIRSIQLVASAELARVYDACAVARARKALAAARTGKSAQPPEEAEQHLKTALAAQKARISATAVAVRIISPRMTWVGALPWQVRAQRTLAARAIMDSRTRTLGTWRLFRRQPTPQLRPTKVSHVVPPPSRGKPLVLDQIAASLA